MTAEQLARKFKARASKVEKEFRKTAKDIAATSIRITRKIMTEEIYGLPIPKRPRSGKPMWKRTGALRRGERAEFPDAYTVRIVNDMNHALPRHEAGKPGRRKVRYICHWRDQLREQIEPYLQDYYEATMRAILEAD